MCITSLTRMWTRCEVSSIWRIDVVWRVDHFSYLAFQRDAITEVNFNKGGQFFATEGVDGFGYVSTLEQLNGVNQII